MESQSFRMVCMFWSYIQSQWYFTLQINLIGQFSQQVLIHSNELIMLMFTMISMDYEHSG